MRKKIFYTVVFLFALQLLALSNYNAAGEHKTCGDGAPAAKCKEQKKPATKVVAELPDETSDISPIANFFLIEI